MLPTFVTIGVLPCLFPSSVHTNMRYSRYTNLASHSAVHAFLSSLQEESSVWTTLGHRLGSVSNRTPSS